MITLSTGNRKLKKTEKIDFLIWNLPAEKTCPFSTAECRKKCYAKKAEKLYPQVLPCRENNLAESKKEGFIQSMIEAIEPHLLKAEKKGKAIFFRIHESGDFYSREYFAKWITIAAHFGGRNIVFQAYTKSIQYVIGFFKPVNLHITFSVFCDTNKNDIFQAIHYGYQLYYAVPKEVFETLPEENKCFCEDCGSCKKCYKNEIKEIYVQTH